MQLSVTSTSDRPDLVPVVAGWLWEAFWRESGKSLDQLMSEVNASVVVRPMPRTFVLIAGSEPVGTASLVAHDLDERPDLSPWLAGVFVTPEARGRGYARQLISAVEHAAVSASVATLWLYTYSAERIYARAGWRTAGAVHHDGKPFVIMRRDLLHGIDVGRRFIGGQQN